MNSFAACVFLFPSKKKSYFPWKKKKKKHDWVKCLGLPYTRYGPASSWFVKYNSRFCNENTNFKYAVDTDEKKTVSLQKMIRLRAEETKEHNQDQPDYIGFGFSICFAGYHQ